MKNKNKELLLSFTKYCKEHPEERFYQALRNWIDIPYVLLSTRPPEGKGFLVDTFHWENKYE